MSSRTLSPATPNRDPGIEGYYRLHAGIYDATRWSFLFGREAILEQAAAVLPAPARILEVGCGTGRNLVALARRFPRATITGVDLSGAMLAIARRKTAAYGSRVTLRQGAYAGPVDEERGHQLVLCSYALSMFNPGFEAALAAARRDLAPGGCIALVDFHHTRHRWFARWMGVNHVRMDGQLRPLLRENFSPVIEHVCPAYGGVWEYLRFVGRKT
jgi:S-adenosylmethionine-diacylgycerolhomoserine-N-methlytransferase